MYKQKILIEALLQNEGNKLCEEIQWYCFLGKPKLCLRIEAGTDNKITLYDENLIVLDDLLSAGDINIKRKADNYINQTFDLSIRLSKEFKFVRVDWIIYNDKIYFEELTFTPYSGFSNIINSKYNKMLGDLINLERIKNEF